MLHLALMSPKGSMALLIVCQSIAILTTFFRLLHRFLDHRVWWDDFWAAVALASDIVIFTVYLIAFRGSILSPPRTPHLGFALRFLTLVLYATALWGARMTVAVTIVRLLPQGPDHRKAKTATVIFFLFTMGMIIQKVLVCTSRSGNAPRCIIIPKYVGVIELVTDFLGDLYLLVFPAHILWCMRLQRAHRRLFLAIFFCGIFTALASIVHAIFILVDSAVWLGIIAHIEVAVAIVVSNLLVLVTYVYRTFRNRSENKVTRKQGPNVPQNNIIKPGVVSVPASSDHNASAMSDALSADSGLMNSNDVASTATISSSSPSTSSSAMTRPGTTIELTQLTHLGSTLDIPSVENYSLAAGSTNAAPSPFSSFSFSTQHYPSRATRSR